MKSRYLMLGVLGFVALAMPACATTQEWATWRQHPTHFASAQHMGFSLRNDDANAARVTRRDLAMARTEAWWGDPVTVSQSQIVDR